VATIQQEYDRAAAGGIIPMIPRERSAIETHRALLFYLDIRLFPI